MVVPQACLRGEGDAVNLDEEMLALRELARWQMQETASECEHVDTELMVTLSEWHSAPWWRVVIRGDMEQVYEDAQGPTLAETLAELRTKLEAR